MASKVGKMWVGRVRSRGEERYGRFGSKQEAVAFERRAREEIRFGYLIPVEPEVAARVPTVAEALATTIPHWRGTKAEGTSVAVARDVARVVGMQQPCTVLGMQDTVNRAMIIWRERGMKESTINRRRSAWSMIIKMNKEQIENRPEFSYRREPQTRARCFSSADEARMLAWCDANDQPRFRDFLMVGFATGYRRGEILNLRPRDLVDVAPGYGDLLLEDTKNGKMRAVEVEGEALEAARRWVRDPLTLWQVRRRWNNMRKALKFEGDREFVIHTMRHTFCTRLVSAGTPLAHVKDIAGHSEISTTLRYVHLMEDEKRQSLRRARAHHAGHRTES